MLVSGHPEHVLGGPNAVVVAGDAYNVDATDRLQLTHADRRWKLAPRATSVAVIARMTVRLVAHAKARRHRREPPRPRF